MTGSAAIGGLIAFVCAAIAVGTDAQNEVRGRFGKRYGTFILQGWPGYAFVVGWGVVDIGVFWLFLHNREWAQRAFNINIDDNIVWAGLVVGLSAVLIFRTNLATVGTTQVGGELLYTFSRAKLIERLNAKRTRLRRAFLTRCRPYCKNIAGYPTYFTSLEATLITLAAGSAQRAEIEAQLASIKSTSAKPNDDAVARETLTGLIYDYFGPTEFDSWADDSDFGNK